MFRHATEYYYQKKIERLEAKIAELQEKLAQIYPQNDSGSNV